MSPPNTGLWCCSGAECQRRWKLLVWQQNAGFKPSLWNNEKKNLDLSVPEPPSTFCTIPFCHFLWTYAWIHGNIQNYSMKMAGRDNFGRVVRDFEEGGNRAQRSSAERTCGRYLKWSHFDKSCGSSQDRSNTFSSHSNLSSSRQARCTSCSTSAYLLQPFFIPRPRPLPRVSFKTDPFLVSDSKPPGTSKCRTKSYFSSPFFFSFFSKDWRGQQACAQVGMHWHALAHWQEAAVTHWLPSHRGLPKQLQTTAPSVFCSYLSSPPPNFILLLLL